MLSTAQPHREPHPPPRLHSTRWLGEELTQSVQSLTFTLWEQEMPNAGFESALKPGMGETREGLIKNPFLLAQDWDLLAEDTPWA